MLTKVVPNRGQHRPKLWLLLLVCWLMLGGDVLRKEDGRTRVVQLELQVEQQNWTVELHGIGFKRGVGAR